MRVRGVAVAALCLAGLAAAPARAADPAFRATVSPERVVFGETKRLTYRVEVTTGESPERFKLVAAAARQFGGQGALLFPTTDGMRLEGPGTLSAGSSAHLDQFPCHSSELRDRHGGLEFAQEYDVDLPAGTTSTVVVEAVVAADAPWPGDRYGMRLRAFPRHGEGATLEAGREIPVAAPEPGGRTGAPIFLDADLPEPASGRCEVPEHTGGAVELGGRTDRALAGQELVLRVVAPGRRSATDLARVRVGADGRFAGPPWRPRALGLYQVAAVYRSQDPARTDDFSVPLAFERVSRSPALAGRSLRAGRSGLVALHLAC